MKQLYFIRNLKITKQNRGIGRKHSHRHHEIVFCTEGFGFQASTAGEERIQKGDLIFYPAGQYHAIYNRKDTTFAIYQIYFDQDLFSTAVNTEKEALFLLGQIKIYARIRSLISLSGIGVERVGKICDSMLWEFQNRYRGYSWAIKHKLVELLLTVLRDSRFKARIKGNVGKPLSNSHIHDVCMYLEADYMNPITIKDILEFCPLSRSHFHALFKEETGLTFIQYLNNIRCEKAAELLVTTRNTILDISLECGFNNLSHFCHTFKALKGVSPRDFRVSQAENLVNTALL
jgi:AraC-like DNA-binding protein